MINDLSKLNLKGKIKSLTETEFNSVYKYEEIQKCKIISNNIYLFNENGNFIEYINYISNEIIVDYRNIYKYNENGNLIELKSYNKDGKLVENNIYDYNEKGYLTEEVLYTDGSLDQKYIYINTIIKGKE